MHRISLLVQVIVFLGFLSGCAPKPIPPVEVVSSGEAVEYLRDVKPILDRRCVVCHSCYNSPCQLKLSSFEGLDRGATKAAVYNAERLFAADPTRLFIDAQSTQAWQTRHGFYSVTDNDAVSERFNNSILISLLEAKRRQPQSIGDYRPEYDKLTCPKNHDELEEYLDEHPNRGMPYGFPPLEDEEFATIAQWLQQGVHGPDAAQQRQIETPGERAQAQIAAWEFFLNARDPKYAMTARYLYEHLYLAHIRFEGTQGEFYELVRSRTAAPAAIEIVPTMLPYDDPGKEAFYYRFRKIHATIVHKTHMVFTLSDAEMRRIRARFIDTAWLEPPHLMDYNAKRSANPFETFAQIPPAARYGFLLDHAEYVVRTFIRGPVCKGQVALNVINDHFWVMFLDPAYDLSVMFPKFLTLNNGHMKMPIELGSNFPAYRLFSDDYIEKAIAYYKDRERFYATIYTDGLGYDAIWKGEKADDAPLLTVYRHFDSASVHRGALGDLPKTLWVIDYPLFERIYYALVAGFDVYGNVGHQMNVRRYMDRLRVEGESYFLDFMPLEQRQALFESWNRNLSKLTENKLFYQPSPMPTNVSYTTDDVKREFVETVIGQKLLKAAGIRLDPVNYFHAGDANATLPERYERMEDYIRAFRALRKPGTGFIRSINGKNSNLAYVRVRRPAQEDLLFSIVINRWHDNVAFMFDEEDRLDASKDSADFIFDFIGSYPNLFFDIESSDAAAFFRMIRDYEDTPEYRRAILKYGITRDDARFWEVYDWFQKRFDEAHPVEAGLFDLNRYYYRAFPLGFDGTLPEE